MFQNSMLLNFKLQKGSQDYFIKFFCWSAKWTQADGSIGNMQIDLGNFFFSPSLASCAQSHVLKVLKSKSTAKKRNYPTIIVMLSNCFNDQKLYKN